MKTNSIFNKRELKKLQKKYDEVLRVTKQEEEEEVRLEVVEEAFFSLTLINKKTLKEAVKILSTTVERLTKEKKRFSVYRLVIGLIFAVVSARGIHLSMEESLGFFYVWNVLTIGAFASVAWAYHLLDNLLREGKFLLILVNSLADGEKKGKLEEMLLVGEFSSIKK